MFINSIPSSSRRAFALVVCGRVRFPVIARSFAAADSLSYASSIASRRLSSLLPRLLLSSSSHAAPLTSRPSLAAVPRRSLSRSVPAFCSSSSFFVAVPRPTSSFAVAASRCLSSSSSFRSVRRLSSKKKRATLDDVVDRLDDVVKALESLKAEFKGFSSNVAEANEIEIVEAVADHLSSLGRNVVSKALLQVLEGKDGRSVMCEADGLITLDDCLVVVEAKSRVRHESIGQLQKCCEAFRAAHGVPVLGYLGGPVFDKGVTDKAREANFGVVGLSGQRYCVLRDPTPAGQPGNEEKPIKLFG